MFHPEGTLCVQCTDPRSLFGVVHVPGPPCLECGGPTGVDTPGYWTCRRCGQRTRFDRERSA